MDRLTATRRHLHGIGESLLAGPQRLQCGRIQLRVTPGGFATTGSPAIRLDGDELVIDDERRVSLTGTFGAIGTATGHGFATPTNYSDHSGVTPDESVDLDPESLRRLTAALSRGDVALRVLAPKESPTLWPEHFDVAILVAGASVGVSPGDDSSPVPYAYVSNTTLPRDDYWNASFGAVRPLDPLPAVAELVTFWQTGLDRLAVAPAS